MIDAEVSQIAYMLDIMKIIEVNVTHDRVDLTGNNDDATQQNKTIFEGNPNNPLDFHNPAVTNLRHQDVLKLKNYMTQQGLDTTWIENVMSGKQNPWEQMRKNDINGQCSQYVVTQHPVTGHNIMVKQN
jgi:hypothetical protein